MSEFQVTVTIRVNADSAQGARLNVEGTLNEGRERGYFFGGEVTSVDAYVAPRTYTQAEFDAAVLAAAENARQLALAGNLEG